LLEYLAKGDYLNLLFTYLTISLTGTICNI
jgi:hypothetical protein